MQRWLLALLLAAWSSLAPAQRVVTIQGTTSQANAAEKNYARRMAEYIDRALADFGLDHKRITDEAVNGAALANASVAILPYNATLPDAELRALQSFMARGGKLIVFFSSDTRLAKSMGFTLGPYIATRHVGDWSAFNFNTAAPAHIPPVVHQLSRNIRPALPAREDARVIAKWQNAAGHPGEHVAWVASPQGYWMSHVLLDDGDDWDKRRMLLAMIAAAAPDLWKPAAQNYLGVTAPFRGSPTFIAGLNAIRARAPSETVAEATSTAADLRARAESAFAAGNFANAITLAHDADRARTRAYGLTVPPRRGERIGIWDHTGAGLYLGNWDRTCAELRRHGVTDIFVNVLWPGVAHYASTVLPRSDTFRIYGDQLSACIAAAKTHGLRVHAWKVCWRFETAPPELMARIRKEGRLQVSDKGVTLPWLCPSHPDNLQYEKDALREVIQNYAVDGVHLDYIRYNDSHVCFCAGCRRRFETFIAAPVKHWPADVKRAPLQAKFESWRAGRVSRLVNDLSSFGRKLRPGLEISAAVFGRYPLCMRSVGQDWGTWLKNDWVDFVCPMNYTENMSNFVAWTREQTALPGGGSRILPGIGATAMESHLGPVEVLDQLEAARAAGAGGIVIFDLNRTVADDVLPILGLSATRR